MSMGMSRIARGIIIRSMGVYVKGVMAGLKASILRMRAGRSGIAGVLGVR